MNDLVVEKVAYHFQDLLTEKKVKTFTKFLSEVFCHFKMSDVNRISRNFIYKELKNIYVFLKEIQHHPSSYLLAHALKPLFVFLLGNLIIPKVVCVCDRKYLTAYKIRYTDLVLAARRRRIIQTECDFFVIFYKGKLSLQQRKSAWLLQPRRNWVFDAVMEIAEKKVELSLTEYGNHFFNFEGWSEEQIGDFGMRLGADYFNSDSKYLPQDFFNKGIPDVPDIPEGH